MLVSHRKKFIYTKTLKTASTSVESYFEIFCVPKGQWKPQGVIRQSQVSESGIIGYRGKYPFLAKWADHTSAEKIQALLGDAIWDEYFKFCVIRNPFEKMVSAFHFFEVQYKQKPDFYMLLHLPNVMRCYKNRQLTTVERFRKWLPPNICSLVDRDKYVIDDQACVDYFIRFESLAEGIETVSKHIRAPFRPDRLKQLVSGNRPKDLACHEYYDSSSIELIEKHFAFELEKFGYQLPQV